MIEKWWFYDLLTFPLSSDDSFISDDILKERMVTYTHSTSQHEIKTDPNHFKMAYFMMTLLLFPYPHIALVYMNVCWCQHSFLECFPPFSFSFLYSTLESDRVFLYDLKLEYQAHKKNHINTFQTFPFAFTQPSLLWNTAVAEERWIVL